MGSTPSRHFGRCKGDCPGAKRASGLLAASPADTGPAWHKIGFSHRCEVSVQHRCCHSPGIFPVFPQVGVESVARPTSKLLTTDASLNAVHSALAPPKRNECEPIVPPTPHWQAASLSSIWIASLWTPSPEGVLKRGSVASQPPRYLSGNFWNSRTTDSTGQTWFPVR